MKHSGFVRISNEYGGNSSDNSILGLSPADSLPLYTFHAGIFTDSLNPAYNNFLLLNLNVNNSRTVGTFLTDPPGYWNYRYESIDPVDLLDTTIRRTDKLFITLAAGDGALFRLSPSLIGGGSLLTSDTVKNSIELLSYLRVPGASKLVINSNVDYEVKDTIEFRDSSDIVNTGYINVSQGGAIIQTDWSKALYRGRKAGHPFLYWSKNTTMQALDNYRIYRKNGNSSWQLSGTTTGTSFLDTTVTILVPGQQSGSEEYYKVVPVNQRGTEGSATNTVSYNINGELLEKKWQPSTKEFTFRVRQNYPNPFNPVTVVDYEIPSDGIVTAELYDITGEKVMEIMNSEKSAGSHRIKIDGSGLSNGVYLFRLKFGEYTDIKKIILLK
jgi:hypothetical protein